MSEFSSTPDSANVTAEDVELIHTPLELPNGRVLPNRLAKAALNENLSSWGGGPPDDRYVGLYRLWGRGNWGLIITGNVQVSRTHLALGRDSVVPEVLTPESIAPFRRVADAVREASISSNESSSKTGTTSRPRPILLAQLCHGGRQSPRVFGGRPFFTAPLGASTVPMKSRSESWIGQQLYALMFVPPKAADDKDIEKVIESFVRGAELAVRAGFDGVQLHCSHGYLLAQFMSPKTNTRPPPYGPPESLYLLQQIIEKIRAITPPDFVLSLKLNASDYVQGGLTEDVALRQVQTLAALKTPDGRTSVDIIEVSGGDYETPAMSAVTSTRQAFFTAFSRKALDAVATIPNPPRIMVTGGFGSASLVARSIRDGHTQIAGLGRASIADPLLPTRLLHSTSESQPISDTFPITQPKNPWWTPPLELASASVGTAHWTSILQRWGAYAIKEGKDVGKVDEEGRVPPMEYEHISAERTMLEIFVPFAEIDQFIFGLELVGITLLIKIITLYVLG